MSRRINIFGGPHSGKSTLIDALTSALVFKGHESTKKEEKRLQFKEWGVYDWTTLTSFKKYIKDDRDLIVNDLNIFLLRSHLTSNITKEAVDIDSALLNSLHELKITIHTVSFSEEAVNEIINIIGMKGSWLYETSNQF